MLRTLLILPLWIWFTTASAVNLDSLWGVWNDKSQPDTNRLNAMHVISGHVYLFSQPDSAYYFAGLNHDLAKATGYKKHMANAILVQGVSYMIQGNYYPALDCFYNSLEIFEQLNHKIGKAHVYTNIGIIYDYQKDYDNALLYYDKCMKINEELGDKLGIANSLNNIGIIYHEQGNVEKALELHEKSLSIKKEIGKKNEISSSYANIGVIYSVQGKLKEALHYFQLSLEIKKENGDKKGIVNVNNQLGRLYNDLGEYDKALQLAKDNLALAYEVSTLNGINGSSKLLYEIYKNNGQPNKALEMYELYIKMRDSMNNKENSSALIKHEYKYKYEKEQAVADAKHQEEMKLSSEREKQQQLLTYGTGAGLLLVLGFALLIFNRFKITKKQKEVIQEKNKHITDSINYARRIQKASLTSTEYLDEVLNEYFIFYQPRDIVSGDFYWIYEIDKDKVMIAVCDCTGHGVPGGFMSMISISLLNEIVVEKGIIQVDEVLGELRSQIIRALNQDQEDAEALDGLDMTLLMLDKNKQSVDFAGAGHTLYQNKGKEIIEHKGDSYPVGYFFGREKPYTRKEISLDKGDVLYLTTDGFTEQFGGKENKLYGIERFKNQILESSELSMEEQKEKFSRSYNHWKGAQKQIDDVCVMGIRV